jgi:hypothetical protein
MNAYELAKLMLDVTDCETSEYHQAGMMLKQQADRIAELEVYEEQIKKIKTRKDLVKLLVAPDPLSDEDINEIYLKHGNSGWDWQIAFAREIEERHGIK